MRKQVVALASVITLRGFEGFSSKPGYTRSARSINSLKVTAMAVDTPSWTDLQTQVGASLVGKALNEELKLREQGKGSAHVQNKLRKFNSDQEPTITLYRDHAGWCPYCQKTMLLVEEKQVPIKIELVPMRSYGDKPPEFMRKVPSGLLPAIEVNGQIITESSVIMELLDEWHQDGYKSMMPSTGKGREQFQQLARLERDWWCTFIFRPEGSSVGRKTLLGGILGGSQEMTGSMQGFMDCIRKVDARLTATKGPWFFDEQDYPTMIDFIYVSHVERMLASCAYWKGLNLRDPKWNLKGLNRWIEAFEKREPYLAFKSDYYTHVKDIPPQYGPGFSGGFQDEQQKLERSITGRDGSWSLPLPHDDPLQPLYYGPPLPLCVLQAAGLKADSDLSYVQCDPAVMADACRKMAAWKLAGNGMNVAKFASRGGPSGSRNNRKTFAAELADPYAEADPNVQPYVDAALRIVCQSLVNMKGDDIQQLSGLCMSLQSLVPSVQVSGVIESLSYLRDRVGVPRDLPLAAARHLRAHLNWAIDSLNI